MKTFFTTLKCQFSEILCCGKKRQRTQEENLNYNSLNSIKSLKKRKLLEDYKEIIVIDNLIDDDDKTSNDNLSQNFTQEFQHQIKDIQLTNEDIFSFNSLNNFVLYKEDLINFPLIILENFKKFIFLLKCLNFNLFENKNFNLFFSSLKSLALGQCINDDVINSYIELITNRQNNLSNYFKKYQYCKVYIFKTYFYELIKIKENNLHFNNYSKFLKNFSKRKINLKEYDKILIPILIKIVNKTNNTNDIFDHWCLVSVNLNKKKIIFYDSHNLNNNKNINNNVINEISTFFDFYLKETEKSNLLKINFLNLSNEFKKTKKLIKNKNSKFSIFKRQISKSKTSTKNSSRICKEEYSSDEEKNTNNKNCESLLDKSFNSEDSEDNNEENNNENGNEKNFNKINKWNIKNANTPQQNNLKDGGIFICKFIENISRNEPITFTNEDIEYFRLLMTVELINSNLICDN